MSGESALGFLVVVILAAILLASVVNFVYDNPPAPSGSRVVLNVGLALWKTPEHYEFIESINWSSLKPNEIKSVVGYLENIGDINLTLSLDVYDWRPEIAGNYISIVANSTAYILKPSEEIAVKFSIFISPSVKGFVDFSNMISLNGSYET